MSHRAENLSISQSQQADMEGFSWFSWQRKVWVGFVFFPNGSQQENFWGPTDYSGWGFKVNAALNWSPLNNNQNLAYDRWVISIPWQVKGLGETSLRRNALLWAYKGIRKAFLTWRLHEKLWIQRYARLLRYLGEPNRTLGVHCTRFSINTYQLIGE